MIMYSQSLLHGITLIWANLISWRAGGLDFSNLESVLSVSAGPVPGFDEPRAAIFTITEPDSCP